MEKNEKVKNNRKAVLIIGICIVLMAALLVTVAVLYPAFKARSALKDITDKLSDGSVKSATVYDPDAGKDLFNDGGIERIASEDERARLSSLILKMSDGSSYASRDAEDIFFDYDYRIRFRLESGEAVAIFLSDGKFYVSNDGVRYFFAAGDESAYLELISFANEIIKSETP